MSNAHRPWWRLPPGVTRGLWDYVHRPSIAEDYDDYFAANELFVLDEQVVASWLGPRLGPGTVVADLGCGTGRALIPLARRGARGLAVDLSLRMLDVVGAKAKAEGLTIWRLRANLAELDAVADGAADHALCLFSTLGMIHGRANRLAALRHARRVLKPGGLLVLHVHNFWYALRDPGGVRRTAWSLLRAAAGRETEAGDRYFPYRGVPNMYLHLFRRGELGRLLRRAGFRTEQWIPLDAPRRRRLPHAWLLGRLRANGWIVVCRAAAR